MQDYHSALQDTIFSLSAINNHTFTYDGSDVILSRDDREAFTLHNMHVLFLVIENHHLVSAFSDLALGVVHKTTAESIDFPVVSD